MNETLTEDTLNSVMYLEVDAEPRYWEDSYLSGVSDAVGNMPLRQGEAWKITINLKTGEIINWPQGIEANIHYKVCDAGLYWLLDSNKNRVLKYKHYYVPNNMLCIDNSGYGDYIIFNIGGNGKIINWTEPYIEQEKWELIK